MYNEITLPFGKGGTKVFLQNGFYDKKLVTKRMHRHNYAEVHLILGEDMKYRVGDEVLEVRSGSMLVIPSGVFHAGVGDVDGGEQTAFQIDAPVEDFEVLDVGQALLSEFSCEIDRCRESGDHTGVCAFITILCRSFLCGEGIEVNRIGDYRFLIHEFFSNRYGEGVMLSDLADFLHLSERQAERLVLEYTGDGFRDHLTKTRIAMARRLLCSSDMSLSEVASYVGYRTYAGFWKAMKKYGDI
ncbi:MAG: helix-turn-helix transcriptional regulator [Clostridia bacterium]|nr:helix-turn-helix transcriptional regulator [Clostridia bacterium]